MARSIHIIRETRAANVGLNGAPFEIQNRILIRKPGNTHLKCRKSSQCRTMAHLAQSQAVYREQDFNEGMCHFYDHIEFSSIIVQVMSFSGCVLHRSSGLGQFFFPSVSSCEKKQLYYSSYRNIFKFCSLRGEKKSQYLP